LLATAKVQVALSLLTVLVASITSGAYLFYKPGKAIRGFATHTNTFFTATPRITR